MFKKVFGGAPPLSVLLLTGRVEQLTRANRARDALRLLQQQRDQIERLFADDPVERTFQSAVIHFLGLNPLFDIISEEGRIPTDNELLSFFFSYNASRALFATCRRHVDAQKSAQIDTCEARANKWYDLAYLDLGDETAEQFDLEANRRVTAVL